MRCFSEKESIWLERCQRQKRLPQVSVLKERILSTRNDRNEFGVLKNDIGVNRSIRANDQAQDSIFLQPALLHQEIIGMAVVELRDYYPLMFSVKLIVAVQLKLLKSRSEAQVALGGCILSILVMKPERRHPYG